MAERKTKRAEAEAAYRAACKAHKVAVAEHADAHIRLANLPHDSPEFVDVHGKWMLASLRVQTAANEKRKAGARVLGFVARGAK